MWQKIQLFIISLWLLFFLILIYTIQIPICFSKEYQFIGLWALTKMNVVPIICFLLMMLGLLFYKFFNYKFIQGAPGLPQKVNEIQDINYETVSFLITYIIPLLFFVVGADISAYRNFIVLILTLLIIGIIYCRTNMFYTNPTLAILGFHIYKVTTNQNKDIIVIIRGKLNLADDFYPRLIDDNIYFIKKS
jgi:hypothetical protein